MKCLIGIMQGRLLPPISGRIQAFPAERWKDEFSIARELNLDCIEFIFDGEDYFRYPLMSDDGIKEIKRLESENGVKILSVCGDYFMNFPLHRGNKTKTDNSISILQKLIERCSMLNVTEIVIPCVDKSKFRSLKEIERFETAVKECLPLAEKYNINITLETDLSPRNFLVLLQKFNSPMIKVNYDIGNSAALGYNPEEEINTYGKWITDVHIKDRILGGGTVPLGEGNANFHVVFEKLREIKFPGIFIFQSARKKEGEEKETIKEYIEFVKQYIH